MTNPSQPTRWQIAACTLALASGLASATGNASEGAQRAAEEEYLDKVNLACGTQLSIRYDAASLKKNNKDIAQDQTGGSSECNEPLRYLYAICLTPDGRAAVTAARLSTLVCKGVGGKVGALTLADGVMTVERAFEEPTPFTRSAAQFERLLGTRLKLSHADPYYDRVWNELRFKPNPVTSTSTYCLLKGEKVKFEDALWDAYARRKEDASVKCLQDGVLVTDVTLKQGRKTGFVTERVMGGSRRTAYQDDRRQGEEHTVKDGKPFRVAFYEQDQELWIKELHPSGTLARYSRKFADGRGELRITADGKVQQLSCSAAAGDDAELRRWCGFGGESTVPVYDGTGKVSRVLSFKEGVIQKESAGDSRYARRSEVAYRDGQKHGEERVLAENGRIVATIGWDRGTKSGEERRYADDGVKVVEEIVWAAGEMRQRTQRFLNGNPKQVERFEGNATRSQQFWDTGKLRTEGSFVRCGGSASRAWCENGVIKTYFESGALQSEVSFLAGRRHGPLKAWWDNGKPERVEAYADGKILESRRWDKDGTEIADEAFEADGSRKLKR